MDLREQLRKAKNKARVGWRSFYNLQNATNDLIKSIMDVGILTDLQKRNIKRIYMSQEPNLRECSICYDIINENISFGNCLHFFHHECLSKVINNKCPECRCELTVKYTV